MATTFIAKYLAANLQADGSYILDAASGEFPDNFDFEAGDVDNIISVPGSPWPASEPVLDHTAAASVLSSSDAGIAIAFPSDQFRYLFTFEMDAAPGSDYAFHRIRESNNEYLHFTWLNATTQLFIQRMTAAGAALNNWTSGTLAIGSAYAVEVRYDNTEAVDDDMLQCRVSGITGSAGALTSGTEVGSPGAAANFTSIDSSNNAGLYHKLGRSIVDNDPDADLSIYRESYPTIGGAAAVISAVSSSRGADIATGNETLTITVDDSTGVTAVTVNGVSCTAVATPTSTSVTCTCPLAFNANYGTLGNVIVNNGTPSTGYAVTLMQPGGMIETDFSVAYASLDTDSPFSGVSTYSALAILDSCVYDAVSAENSIPLSMSSLGVFTVTGSFTVNQTYDFYIFDDSDNTAGNISVMTVLPDGTIILGDKALKGVIITGTPITGTLITGTQ